MVTSGSYSPFTNFSFPHLSTVLSSVNGETLLRQTFIHNKCSLCSYLSSFSYVTTVLISTCVLSAKSRRAANRLILFSSRNSNRLIHFFIFMRKNKHLLEWVKCYQHYWYLANWGLDQAWKQWQQRIGMIQPVNKICWQVWQPQKFIVEKVIELGWRSNLEFKGPGHLFLASILRHGWLWSNWLTVSHTQSGRMVRESNFGVNTRSRTKTWIEGVRMNQGSR